MYDYGLATIFFYLTYSKQKQTQLENYPESTLRKNPLLTNAAQEVVEMGLYAQGYQESRYRNYEAKG